MPAEISSNLKDHIVKWYFEDDYTAVVRTDTSGRISGRLVISLHVFRSDSSLLYPLHRDIAGFPGEYRQQFWSNYPNTMQQIADLAGISLGLISNTIALHCQYVQVTNPFRNRSGHPRILNDGDLAYLTEILQVNPTLYLDELSNMSDEDICSPLARRAILHTRKSVRKLIQ
ncbi:hypothetical protein B0H10DRAFT_2224039 [Mycena sp. CBHHK59/15]|nr:hypothetical protein B0H10DRAFT_2224039 [Mycena sp. CBHHK59/15]